MFTFFVFFFSSRRRHTRLVSDWSSDVCSSDLQPEVSELREQIESLRQTLVSVLVLVLVISGTLNIFFLRHVHNIREELKEIGRASCRERGENWDGESTVKRKRG